MKAATFGWLGFVAIAFLLGAALGAHVLAQSDAGDGESGRASKTLGHAGFKQPATELVLIQSRSLTTCDARFRTVIGDVVHGVSNAPHVVNVHSPATTKGGIVNFSAGLAQLLAPRGISVNSVLPGPVWTPLIPSTLPPDQVEGFGADTPLGRPAQPAELAPVYVQLASDEAGYVSGAAVAVTGGKPVI